MANTQRAQVRRHVGALIALLLLSGCSGATEGLGSPASPSPENESEEDATIDVNETPTAVQRIQFSVSTTSFIFFLPYVTEALGYFADENLEVDFIETPSGTDTAATLASGEVQLTQLTSQPAMILLNAAQDVKVIGPALVNPGVDFVVSSAYAEEHGLTEESSLEDLADTLEGAKISYTRPGSESDNVARLLASEAGLDPERDVELVSVSGAGETYAALQQGLIDIMIFAAPLTTQAVAEGEAVRVVCVPCGEMPQLDFLSSVFVTHADVLAEDSGREGVLRAVRALARTMDTLEQDPGAVEKAALEVFSETDEDLVRQSFQTYLDAYPVSMELSDETLREAFEFYAERSDEDVPSLEGVIDRGLVEEALSD